ncbi:MAG: M48 family metallopeptidase [Thermoprotei archaeon]
MMRYQGVFQSAPLLEGNRLIERLFWHAMLDGHLLIASIIISSVAFPLAYFSVRMDKRTGEKVILMAMAASSLPLFLTPLSPLIFNHRLLVVVRAFLTHDLSRDLIIAQHLGLVIGRWMRWDPEVWLIGFAGLTLGLHVAFGMNKRSSIETPKWVDKRAKAIAERMGTKAPKVVLIDSGEPSAYASLFRNKIVISLGLLESLDKNEISAVLAHEMSHIKHHDPLKRLLSRTLRVITLANPASHFMEPWLSRNEEYAADVEAALITKPEYMISALLKVGGIEISGQSAANWLSHGLLVPRSSLTGGQKGLLKLFSSHPSLADRITNLMSLMDF